MVKALLILSLWSWNAVAQTKPLVEQHCRSQGFELWSALAKPQIDKQGKATAVLAWKKIPDEWNVHRGNFVAVYLELPNEESPHWQTFSVQVASKSEGTKGREVASKVGGDKSKEWQKTESFELYDPPSTHGRYVKKMRFPDHIAGLPEEWPRLVEVIVLKNDQPQCSFRIKILGPSI